MYVNHLSEPSDNYFEGGVRTKL